MTFYPAFLDLRGRNVLVIGGGQVGEWKVEGLLEAGAAVTVVSLTATPRLTALAAQAAIRLHLRPFMESDLDGAALVISATGDTQAQQEIALAARARNIWANTVDQPELCDFIVPAIVRRGAVTVAISTAGKSPALAAALREKLEATLSPQISRVAEVMGAVRATVHERFPDPERRRRVFESIISSGIMEWIEGCDDETAEQRVRNMIDKLT